MNLLMKHEIFRMSLLTVREFIWPLFWFWILTTGDPDLLAVAVRLIGDVL